MAVTLPVTTTTCVTWPSCSGLTLVTRWCFSPLMELGLATSSVAQFKVSTPLLTLGPVSVTKQHLSCLKSIDICVSLMPIFFYTSELRRNVHDCPFFFILLGSNVTAAFEAQRHAEPHGPLVGSQLDTFDPILNSFSFLSGNYVVFTGELWVLHRLAGPLGVTSLCCAICCCGKVAQWDPGCGSKCQHVS